MNDLLKALWKDTVLTLCCGILVGVGISSASLYAVRTWAPAPREHAPSLMPPLFAPRPGVDIQVYFSPGGGCTDALVERLNAAGRNIYVQAYSFTSAPIEKALVAAKKRGVNVEVILDKSQKTAQFTEADELIESGVPTWYDCAHAIAHNKVMIIDDTFVVGGSFNYTNSAESHNAENLTIIMSKSLAAAYKENWIFHQEHSEIAAP